MGRFKIKKKDTFIDMTAMSDVTVLLLTFFMLTSSFVNKEVIKVQTPGSVSEISIPETNIMTILIEPSGKVFFTMDKHDDLMGMIDVIKEKYGVSLSSKDARAFSNLALFGVPIKQLGGFLALSEEKQEEYLKSSQNPGIPCDSTNNEFKSWVQAAEEVNPEFRLAIKADAGTPYEIIKNVMNTLREIQQNRYNLITALKGEEQ